MYALMYGVGSTAATDTVIRVPLDPYAVRLLHWRPKKLSREERRCGRSTNAHQRRLRMQQWLYAHMEN